MKTIVFDIDGTICFDGQQIPEPIVQALSKVIEHGTKVIFASARPIRDLLPVLPEQFHKQSLIGGNGSLIQENGIITHATSFSADTRAELSHLLSYYDTYYLADSQWDYAFHGPMDHPMLDRVDPQKLAKCVSLAELPSLVKLLVLHSENWTELEQDLNKLPIVIHRHRNEQVLDISPPNVHKWSALQKLGLQERQFIAFGNDANDVTMFAHAKKAIMIGSHDQLIDLATSSIPLDGNHIECIASAILAL